MTAPVHTVYHGTTPESAEKLCSAGWSPRSGSRGGNMGNPALLYVSSVYEDALWFSEQKGCSTVLRIEVPETFLVVDPEDGYPDTMEECLEVMRNSPDTPVKLAVTRPLPAMAFSVASVPENSQTETAVFR